MTGFRKCVLIGMLICLALGAPGCIDDDNNDGMCCPARIYGTVRTAADGAAVKGIEIRVAATGDFDISDTNGTYAMEIFEEGLTQITATDIDGADNGGPFAPVTINIDLISGEEQQIDFALIPE